MQKRHFNSSISSQWFSRLSQTYLLSIWFSVLCFCLVLLCFPFHFNTPPESANAFKHDTRTSTDRHITFVMYRILRVFFPLSNGNDYARRALPKSHFKFNEMNWNPAKERTNEPILKWCFFLPIGWCVCVYLWLGRSLSNHLKKLVFDFDVLVIQFTATTVVFIWHKRTPARFCNFNFEFFIQSNKKLKRTRNSNLNDGLISHIDRIHFMQLH